MKPVEEVIVALGSNLGESEKILHWAFSRLQSVSLVPILRSSIWRTEPVGCPPGSPPFLNAAARLACAADVSPAALLEQLKRWEQEAGRIPKKILNESRPLDLDLIMHGSASIQTPSLTLPHPRARERFFVLAPLAEIRADLVLPGEAATVAELLSRLQPAGARIIRP